MAALALSLGALYAGHWIQFDDVSGFGHAKSQLPFAVLATALALGALVVVIPDRQSRRWLGLALAATDVLVVVLAVTDDGFRFIFGGDEGELFLLGCGMAVVAVALLVFDTRQPTNADPREAAVADNGDRARRDGVMPWVLGLGLLACWLLVAWFALSALLFATALVAGTVWYLRGHGGIVRNRLIVYVELLVVLPITGFSAGVAAYDRRYCSAPDFDGECDVAVLEGLAYAVTSLVVLAIVVLTAEITLERQRKALRP